MGWIWGSPGLSPPARWAGAGCCIVSTCPVRTQPPARTSSFLQHWPSDQQPGAAREGVGSTASQVPGPKSSEDVNPGNSCTSVKTVQATPSPLILPGGLSFQPHLKLLVCDQHFCSHVPQSGRIPVGSELGQRAPLRPWGRADGWLTSLLPAGPWALRSPRVCLHPASCLAHPSQRGHGTSPGCRGVCRHRDVLGRQGPAPSLELGGRKGAGLPQVPIRRVGAPQGSSTNNSQGLQWGWGLIRRAQPSGAPLVAEW